MKRWMVVAEPRDPDNDVHFAAATAWNKTYLRDKANRYWTSAGALMDIASDYDAHWGDWVHFRIVRVTQFEAGWR
jgi:hypothetical protein